MSKARKSKRDAFRVSPTYRKGQLAFPGCEEPGGFDEIVVGQWLHLERMNTGQWWFRLGDREADIDVDANGKATVRWREGEGVNG